jgi:hypothetical protein
VLLGVQLGGLIVMLGGMQVTPVRHARMMRSLFVIAGFGFAVMFGRPFVMMRGLFVMLVQLPGCSDAAASIASFDEPIATGVCQFLPRDRGASAQRWMFRTSRLSTPPAAPKASGTRPPLSELIVSRRAVLSPQPLTPMRPTLSPAAYRGAFFVRD